MGGKKESHFLSFADSRAIGTIRQGSLIHGAQSTVQVADDVMLAQMRTTWLAQRRQRYFVMDAGLEHIFFHMASRYEQDQYCRL